MTETCKCPKCSELLGYYSAVSHLTTVHGMPLREAVRWAGLHLGLLGGGDGKGEM